MSYFPMCVDLTGRRCLVIGGGSVAAGKVRALCSFGADVTVIARAYPHGPEEFEAGEAKGHVAALQREFRESDLEGVVLVVAATDDAGCNERVYRLCTERRIPVNVVDRKERCTFMFPSVVKYDDLVVSVSTGGNSPAMAAYLRRKLEDYIPSVYGDVNRQMGEVRDYIHASVPGAAGRKAAFTELLGLLLGERALRIGTRSSALALAQTELFCLRLHEMFPDIRCEIVPLKTLGDRLKERPLKEMGGKGIFVEVLEDALRDGTIDCAVHSAKDMSSSLPKDLRIACVLPREDASDVLIQRKCDVIDGKFAPLVIGTGSPRREAQLKRLFPDCTVENIRGNLPTRLEKLRSGACDAIVLAAAGLKRLGLDHEKDLEYLPLPIQEVVPAGGQGTIAVETGKDRLEFLGILTDPEAALALETERRILRRIGAGCHDAVGVYARTGDNRRLQVDLWKAVSPASKRTVGMVYRESHIFHLSRTAAVSEASELADMMAEELIAWERCH